jgi:xanthine dehydrogenase YagS FAD-binding subunit
VAAHPSDPAAALLALDAKVRLTGARTVPLDAFFREPEEDRRTETTLEADALLEAIELPAREGWRSTYLKAMDRKAWAFALAGVAAAAHAADGEVTDVRIVLSGVAPIPWRARAAEQALAGLPASETAIERAAEAAVEGARPLSQNGYKVDLVRALVRRALLAISQEPA